MCVCIKKAVIIMVSEHSYSAGRSTNNAATLELLDKFWSCRFGEFPKSAWWSLLLLLMLLLLPMPPIALPSTPTMLRLILSERKNQLSLIPRLFLNFQALLPAQLYNRRPNLPNPTRRMIPLAHNNVQVPLPPTPRRTDPLLEDLLGLLYVQPVKVYGVGG